MNTIAQTFVAFLEKLNFNLIFQTSLCAGLFYQSLDPIFPLATENTKIFDKSNYYDKYK